MKLRESIPRQQGRTLSRSAVLLTSPGHRNEEPSLRP